MRLYYVIFLILVLSCSGPETDGPNPCESDLIKTFEQQVRGKEIDIDGDSINDISFPSEIFTSSTGDLVYAEIETLSDIWFISTRKKNDTLVIDTTTRIETRYYREDIHDHWDSIRQSTVPRVFQELDQANCTELDYDQWARVYYDRNIWHPDADHDFTNPGLDSLDGFLLLKNETECYALKFRSVAVSMYIGELFQICE